MKKSNFFWVGFADLMTSLFFIMLILYVVSFALYKKQISDTESIIKELENKNLILDSLIIDLKEKENLLLIQAEKAKIIEEVENNLKPLINNSSLFKYEDNYKRFTLNFKVHYNLGRFKINNRSLINPNETIDSISMVGNELQRTINILINNPGMKNVSYLVIIAGYSSKLLGEDEFEEYERSYKRAYFLWDYWKGLGINFEDSKYKGLIDLQIAGNGWGGVGRFARDPENSFKNETNNQRFIIQIVPKIGKENKE